MGLVSQRQWSIWWVDWMKWFILLHSFIHSFIHSFNKIHSFDWSWSSLLNYLPENDRPGAGTWSLSVDKLWDHAPQGPRECDQPAEGTAGWGFESELGLSQHWNVETSMTDWLRSSGMSVTMWDFAEHAEFGIQSIVWLTGLAAAA